MNWVTQVNKLNSVLNDLTVHNYDGAEIDNDAAFLEWKNATLRIREEKKTIYLIGNGASASMASHAAADLAKNAQVHTEVFSDLSLITALGNDMGYENVFIEPLRQRICSGDMLVAISSSGQSRNIILAAEEVKHIARSVVTLSAMNPNNKLRSMGKLNFYVPAETYGLAETGHAAILHYWIDQIICDVSEYCNK